MPFSPTFYSLEENAQCGIDNNTQCRIDYYKKGDLSRRWKYCKTMHSAITKAYQMVQDGNYTIIGIETEYSPIGQEK